MRGHRPKAEFFWTPRPGRLRAPPQARAPSLYTKKNSLPSSPILQNGVSDAAPPVGKDLVRDPFVGVARLLLKATREPFALRTGPRLLLDRFRCEYRCVGFLRYHRLEYVPRITSKQEQDDGEHTHRVPSRKVEALRGSEESSTRGGIDRYALAD